MANIRGEWKSYGYGGSLEGNANWEIQWLLCRGEEGAYEIHDAKINGSEGSLAPSVAPLPPSHSISLRLSYSKCLLLRIQVLFTRWGNRICVILIQPNFFNPVFFFVGDDWRRDFVQDPLC